MSGPASARELVFVKLGGSLITDKARPYTARRDVIERLCEEVRAARQARPLSLVVGHGGGSFPHVSAKRYRTAEGIVDERSWEGFVRVHEDAARLNAIVRDGFAAAGERAVTVQPSAACVTRGGRIVELMTRPIELLLEAGLIPLPYGDVCLDTAQGCAIVSTEEIFRALAEVLRPARIVLAGKVDGVLDAEGKVIPRICPADLPRIEGALRGSDGVADVTGGMLQKVRIALELGAPTVIVNGLVPGLLERVLGGEAGLGTSIEG